MSSLIIVQLIIDDNNTLELAVKLQDRSEEDDGLQSDSSYEEDEDIEQEEYEDNRKTAENFNQEEQLENAENQKISSEKMSSSLHRLHVEFDDLSVVDEEEEPRKDKERKEATPSEEGQKDEEVRHPTPILGPRQLHDNIPFYPATYEPTSAFGGTSYYTECPFEFPSAVDLMLPTDTSMLLASPYSGLQPDPLIPLAGLDAGLDRMADSMLPRIHVPPVGWQNDVTPQKHLPAYSATNVTPIASTTAGIQITGKPDSHPDYSFLRKRNEQLTKLQDVSAIQHSRTQFLNPEEAIGKKAWNILVDSIDRKEEKNAQNLRAENRDVEEIATVSAVPERPKHFFAPLPSKLKRQEEESPTASTSHFGTGTSSSSGKTASTVISRTNPFVGQKGSADIYVNGAISCDSQYTTRDRDESRTFLSTDNLLITDSRSAPSSQLTKSVSCQDLSSEYQSVVEQLKLNVDSISQMLAKSDNTLDNITNDSSDKPYKSHLNVTLKIPRPEKAPSPETPEIPNLPSIDYRFFRNPFLRNFDNICPNYQVEAPTTKPLSVQVNDDGLAYQYPTLACGRGFHLDEKFRTAQLPEQNRLLITSDQLTSGKDIQVTSFEKPSPCTLIPSATPYDPTILRRLNANRYLQSQNLYQNIPFVPPRGQFYSQKSGMMYYDNIVTKVPAQTQTSIDGDSHHEDERQDDETISAPNSPSGQRRKKSIKKDKILVKDQGPLSPAAQRRLKKQSSVTSTDTTLDSPGKMARKKTRKLSTTTTSDAQEDKNESRSSSSGQDSPRKDQNRRVSVCVNSKRRSSQTSLKTSRSGSVDVSKDKYDCVALNSERERTNSVSSRETSVKARKTSTSSGNVPWCACWGNGCI